MKNNKKYKNKYNNKQNKQLIKINYNKNYKINIKYYKPNIKINNKFTFYNIYSFLNYDFSFLEKLILNNCDCYNIPLSIHIKELNLFNCLNVNKCFNKFPNLKILSLYSKNLNDNLYIPFYLYNIEELYIFNYDIKFISNYLINLKSLSLNNCKIINFPKLYNLLYLNLFDMNINFIPNYFFNLNKLYLYNCNNISFIPSFINLKYLYINSCLNIKSIPKTLINLKYFKYINYYLLDKLPNNFFPFYNFINLKKFFFNDFIFIN